MKGGLPRRGLAKDAIWRIMPRRFFKRDIVPSRRRTMSAIFHMDVGAARFRGAGGGPGEMLTWGEAGINGKWTQAREWASEQTTSRGSLAAAPGADCWSFQPLTLRPSSRHSAAQAAFLPSLQPGASKTFEFLLCASFLFVCLFCSLKSCKHM